MKLGAWLAWLGAVGFAGFGLGLVASAEGCTATVDTGSGGGDDDAGGGSSSSGAGGSSSGSSGGGDDAGPATQIDAGNTPLDPCLSCEYGLCSGLYSVCITSPGCLAIYQCANAPACVSDATGACVTACIDAEDVASQTIYAQLGACDHDGACFGGSCASTCNPPASYCTPAGNGDGGLDGGGPEDSGTADASGEGGSAPQSCQACQSTLCIAQLAQCSAGNPCAVYDQCVLGCASADCTSACQTDNPRGYDAARALGSCTAANCSQCTQAQ
jgi:hypothetical protein